MQSSAKPRPVIVSVEVETCTGHRLVDYKGKCANLHGHNYRFIVEMCTPVEDRAYGMSVDFGVLKNALKQITDIFDHAMVLRDDDPFTKHPDLVHANKIVLLNVNPTAENMAQYVADEVFDMFPESVWVNCTVWETSKCMVNARGVRTRTVEITSFVGGNPA